MTPRIKDMLRTLAESKKSEDVTEAAFEVMVGLLDDIHSMRLSLETIAREITKPD